MSGGSYDYLCYQDRLDPGAVKSMAAALEGVRANDAAKATRNAPALLSMDDPLRELWHAMEWWVSGDYDEDQFRTELVLWRQRHVAPTSAAEVRVPLYALTNLVDAAIKHGGTVEVAAAIAHIEVLARQQGFELREDPMSRIRGGWG